MLNPFRLRFFFPSIALLAVGGNPAAVASEKTDPTASAEVTTAMQPYLDSYK